MDFVDLQASVKEEKEKEINKKLREEGLVPGTGAILAALEAATEVTPLVVGKPQPTLIELAMRRMGVDRDGTAIVGDRLETDILGAKNAGMPTALVLTGVTKAKHLADSEIQPDWVFEDLEKLSSELD